MNSVVVTQVDPAQVTVQQEAAVQVTVSAVGTQGIQGPPGADGADGVDGVDGADGADGADGQGVPTGGTIGQYLRKVSGTDYDTEWASVSEVDFPLKAPTGVLADPPSYGFAGGDDDTGMFSTGDGNVSIQANGVLKAAFNQNDFHLYAVSGGTVHGDLDVTGNFSAANYPPTGDGNHVAFYDANDSNKLSALQFHQLSGNGEGGLYIGGEMEVTDNGFKAFEDFNPQYIPSEDSPTSTRVGRNIYYEIDPDKSGFEFGTGGNAVTHENLSIQAYGTGNLGSINAYNVFIQVGDGVDGFEFGGGNLFAGNFQINEDVVLTSGFNGFQYRVEMDASVTFDGNVYINSFYDNSDIDAVLDGNYTGFSFGPAIEGVADQKYVSGFSCSPQIQSFEGTSGLTCYGASPFVGEMGEGSLHGFQFNPQNNTEAHDAYGIWITMDNVTTFAGTQESLVIQDLTITFNQPGVNNIQVEYVDDGTAGAETAALAGNLITVHMEDGVSTANQIKSAIEANFTLNANLDVTVSGVGTDTQIAQGPTGFTGGAYPGAKKAGYFDGDVEITGALTFGGNLSLGAMNAFSSNALVNGGGQPTSGHSLITQWTCPDNSTIALADTLGINTAALISLGADSAITTGFLGVTALGLPAVFGAGANTTVDRVGGAAFALSLDASAGAGSEIDIVSLCRSLAIPNGITAVNRLYGYEFSLPFGDPGTATWSFYSDVATGNFYNLGAVKIGGSDTPTNASVALEVESTTKAILNARMTSTQRDALTAVNGMVIYNSTTDKLQAYAGGSWVDLH